MWIYEKIHESETEQHDSHVDAFYEHIDKISQNLLNILEKKEWPIENMFIAVRHWAIPSWLHWKSKDSASITEKWEEDLIEGSLKLSQFVWNGEWYQLVYCTDTIRVEESAKVIKRIIPNVKLVDEPLLKTWDRENAKHFKEREQSKVLMENSRKLIDKYQWKKVIFLVNSTPLAFLDFYLLWGKKPWPMNVDSLQTWKARVDYIDKGWNIIISDLILKPDIDNLKAVLDILINDDIFFPIITSFRKWSIDITQLVNLINSLFEEHNLYEKYFQPGWNQTLIDFCLANLLEKDKIKKENVNWKIELILDYEEEIDYMKVCKIIEEWNLYKMWTIFKLIDEYGIDNKIRYILWFCNWDNFKVIAHLTSSKSLYHAWLEARKYNFTFILADSPNDLKDVIEGLLYSILYDNIYDTNFLAKKKWQILKLQNILKEIPNFGENIDSEEIYNFMYSQIIKIYKRSIKEVQQNKDYNKYYDNVILLEAINSIIFWKKAFSDTDQNFNFLHNTMKEANIFDWIKSKNSLIILAILLDFNYPFSVNSNDEDLNIKAKHMNQIMFEEKPMKYIWIFFTYLLNIFNNIKDDKLQLEILINYLKEILEWLYPYYKNDYWKANDNYRDMDILYNLCKQSFDKLFHFFPNLKSEPIVKDFLELDIELKSSI